MDFMRDSLTAMAQRKGRKSFPEVRAAVDKLDGAANKERAALENLVVGPDGDSVRHAFEGGIAHMANDPRVTIAARRVIFRGVDGDMHFRDSAGRRHFFTMQAAMQPGSRYEVPVRVAAYVQPLLSVCLAEYVTDSSEDLLKAAEEVLRQRAAAGQQAVAEAAAAAGVTWDTEAVEAASSKFSEQVALALAPVRASLEVFTAALYNPEGKVRRRVTKVLEQAAEDGRAGAQARLAAGGRGCVQGAAEDLAERMAPRALQLLRRGDEALVQAISPVFQAVCVPFIQCAQLAISEAVEQLRYWRPLAAPGSDWHVYSEQARLLATIEVQVLGALLQEGLCSLHWDWAGAATCDTEVLVDWL